MDAVSVKLFLLHLVTKVYVLKVYIIILCQKYTDVLLYSNVGW